MNNSVEILNLPTDAPERRRGRYIEVRIFCWCLALALGGAQAWAARFSMNPDGVSYLDIGDAYWRGDWHNAINAYWSPLYSWILGFFLRVIRPSAYWEYPLVHLVNFLIYVASLACFEYFLMTFIADRRRRDQKSLKDGQTGLPESAWWLLGYSLFLSSSLVLIGVYLATPDMCVAAFAYLASALVLKIGDGTVSRRTYWSLGLVLGFAFLAKSVMLPLGVVYLGCALLGRRVHVISLALSAAIFLVTTAPFVVTISNAKGHFSIGESGRWNYLVFIDGVHPFFPERESQGARTGPEYEALSIHQFSGSVPGTYPPWSDPSYWQKDIRTRFNARNQLLTMGRGIRTYWQLVSSSFLHLPFTIGIVLLVTVFRARSKGPHRLLLPLLLPTIAAFAAFDFLLVTFRYVGAFVTLFWLVVFGTLTFGVAIETLRLVKFTVACIAVTGSLVPILSVGYQVGHNVPPTLQEAAYAMRERGIRSYDAVALIWDEDWEAGAAEGPFVPRLLKARVVSEAEPARSFWKADSSTQEEILKRLFGVVGKAALTRNPPAGANMNGWEQLGETEYWARFR